MFLKDNEQENVEVNKLKAVIKYKDGKKEEFKVQSTIEVWTEGCSNREFLEFPGSKSEKKFYYLDECEIALKAE